MESVSPDITIDRLPALTDEVSANGFKGRGIPFAILMDQVRNTAPFIFGEAVLNDREPHLKGLREWAQRPSTLKNAEMSHGDYFRLCLQVHHATVATFVPTDVDVHIRFKLWQPPLTEVA